MERDLEKSYHWYLESAISGNPRSQYQVAMMLSEGIGVEKDEEESMLWFRRNVGSEINDVRLYAIDAAQKRKICDSNDVLTLLRSASDSGYNRATIKLADMTLNGWGVKKDMDAAMQLYELSAKRSMRGKADFAKAILENDPQDDDKVRSFELFKQATDNGDAYAMYGLACMYRDGCGVPEDRGLYKYYTRMAADAGNKDAIAVVKKWDFKEKKRQKKEADAKRDSKQASDNS